MLTINPGAPDHRGHPLGILGTGSYLPARVVHSPVAGGPAGLDAARIVRKPGLHARRWAAPEEATSDLAVHAGRAALANAGIPISDVGVIVVATSTPDS